MLEKPLKVAVIGGSGFYSFLSDSEEIVVDTPFSQVSIKKEILNDRIVFFLPRHGSKHKKSPHLVNYKANICALEKLGVERIISTNAVGSVLEQIKPGDFVLLDQFIDFGSMAVPVTFFDGNFSYTFSDGKVKSGVVHTDVTEPYCPHLRGIFKEKLRDHSNFHPTGTYFQNRGPRFETRAEVNAVRVLGGTVVGMTNPYEAILSRELNMCYATLAIVTNYAAGIQSEVTHQEVIDVFNQNIEKIQEIFRNVISVIPVKRLCNCSKME